MMDHVLNAAKQQAQGIVNGIDHPRIGIVKNYDPETYCCRVLLQPENALTGWLPICSPWVGNGWGMFAPPADGVAVAVIPKDGSYSAAFVLPGFFNDEEQPLAVPRGEFWLVHQKGASVKLTNDGKLAVDDGHGAAVVLNGDGTIASTGNWQHTGNFKASGDVSDSKGTMQEIRDKHNLHTHTGDGAANPPAPTSPPITGQM